ncbi:DUF2142 domain-containing protein [Cryobacterium sp. PH31-O1]|uniref:DUF2142 domain-containing protein n=1 Tax=Cryobacterium sp. PH31-O1 TaxID=3046306 RepID=UPI0024BB9305|nr:DUF2142 domain-containing protein [Cryobacterium sp. PH31-O1]MDJ0337578.1 DUF2142 domain-containing protein [Cryobacterium sp. PH31-O1]
MPPATSASYPRAWHTFLVAFFALLALSGCWAAASPLMSVPDEPSHAIKAAAVVRGELTGTVTAESPFPEVIVPKWVALSHELTCFAFQADVAPSCAAINLVDVTQETSVSTSAAYYNPVYYAITGLPSLFLDGKVGFYAMRLVSAALSCLLLASMFQALALMTSRRWTAIAAAVAVTPMVLYLNAAVNPNSLEIAATGAVFANLALLLEQSGRARQSVTTTVWFTAAAALLANARGLSLVFLLAAVVLAVMSYRFSRFLAVLRHPITWIGATIIAVSTAFALWWIATVDALSTTPFGGAGSTFRQGFEVTMDKTFEYTTGLIGYFGWLDAPAPGVVLWVWATLIGSLLLGVLALGRGRALSAAILAALALLLLPPLFQALIVTESGYIWQGRYNLALYILLMLTAGRALDRTLGRQWIPTMNRVLVVGLSVAIFGHLAAFLWPLRRYVTGIRADQFWIDMVRNPQWQPPFGWIAWVALYAVILCGTALIIYPGWPVAKKRL